jgi:serine/threonine-protein kinase
MTPERYQQVKRILKSAVECDTGRRAAFVAEVCADDEQLRIEVESLLRHQQPAADFIEESAFEVTARMLADGEDESAIGRHIGPYRITGEIGRGGMGAVYLAVRDDEQYQKQVAIKLVKRGMDTDAVIRRFRNERQILAQLEHPNIARLIDGGTTEDGLPYFVMEYVEGLPIDAYCDSHKLSTDERLKLFRAACSAVQFAHQNLVIHRDLKPNNIMVTAEGVPKLLDFGIAKVLHADSSLPTEMTVTALRVMTPEYASPEQIRGETIMTASDVYSLGVVLYELLTGQRPYQIKSKEPFEIARIICEKEPGRPSGTGRTDAFRAPTSVGFLRRVVGALGRPSGRAQQPKRLLTRGARARTTLNLKSLRGDLDNIVLMAMRKEPQRRYSSVEQFSEDIRRHLEGLPVIARKDTLSYRSAKFIGRNRVAVAAAALVCLTLLAGIVATTREAKVAAREAKLSAGERDTARIETAKAERINKFLQDMLSSADANWYSSGHGGKGEDTKVVDVLNQAAQRLETDLSDQPEVKAELYRTIGTTYLALGRFKSAVPQFQASLKIYRELYGEKHLKVAAALYYLAASLSAADDRASAEPLYREALEMQRALPGGDNVYLFHIVREYSRILLTNGDAARAEPLMLEAVELARKHYGNDHMTMGVAYENLGLMYEGDGELDKAEAEYQQALDVFNRTSEASSATRISTLVNLSRVLGKRQKYQEAERLLGQALELFRTSTDRNEFYLGNILRQSALISSSKHNYATAEEQATESVEIARRASTGIIAQGTLAEALDDLGLVLINSGKPAQAEPYLREALTIRSTINSKGHPQVAAASGLLGECLTKQKRYREAESLLVESYNDLESSLGEQNSLIIEAQQRLVKLYEDWGKPNLAARYRSSQ